MCAVSQSPSCAGVDAQLKPKAPKSPFICSGCFEKRVSTKALAGLRGRHRTYTPDSTPWKVAEPAPEPGPPIPALNPHISLLLSLTLLQCLSSSDSSSPSLFLHLRYLLHTKQYHHSLLQKSSSFIPDDSRAHHSNHSSRMESMTLR